jgi:hypothetical protein
MPLRPALLLLIVGGCMLDRSGAGDATATSTTGGGGEAGGTGGSFATGPAAGGTGGAGSAGGQGGCASPAAEYHVLRTDVAPMVDGSCLDPAWTRALPIGFQLPNHTNNFLVCRFLWMDASPDVFFACCDVTDSALEANTQTHDGDIWQNDGMEYFLAPAPSFGPTTVKTFVSVNGTTRDGVWDAFEDTTYESQLTLAATPYGNVNLPDPDQGYAMEWRHDLLVPVDGAGAVACNFLLNDRDDGVRTVWQAFGSNDDINDPSNFGTCWLSCDTSLR